MIELAAAAIIVAAQLQVEAPAPFEAEWYPAYLHHQNNPPQPKQIRLEPRAYRGMGGDTERWRALVAAYFPADSVDTMLCLMSYESGGNPDAKNPGSSAAGLFQIMGFWYNDTFGMDPYDPVQNVDMAARIYAQQGYGAWNPYGRGLCRG